MSRAWDALGAELARWADGGRTAEFWWRDDDAGRADPALERLAALSARTGTPLALAVIPAAAEPEMLAALGPTVAVIQHGADHRNRAAAGGKKTEFPESEEPGEALARLAAGRARLAALAGTRAVAALAPPWNRIAAGLVPRLAASGFTGLSLYGARAAAAPAPGLRQVNTHVDIVDWGAGRGFVGEERALELARAHLAARREGRADGAEPTGWLTHHARHDEAAWAFLERLFEFTRGGRTARWRAAAELFA
jgi:hypothetical protein